MLNYIASVRGEREGSPKKAISHSKLMVLQSVGIILKATKFFLNEHFIIHFSFGESPFSIVRHRARP